MNLLIAEDDPVIQRIYRRILHDHELVIVDSAPLAITALEQSEVDVIFSDYDLAGGTSGADIWDWVSANRPLLRFVLVSGRVRVDLPVPKLQKPFTAADLRRYL